MDKSQAQRGQPIGDRKVLESLPSRARTTGERAAARSRLVRKLRIALPIVAVVLIAAFVFNTRNSGADDVFLNEFQSLTAAAEELKMANPRFAGVDGDGVPFEITADFAIQEPDGQEKVKLENPRATQGAAEERSVVTARSGLYESEANILELSDGVQLDREIGADIYVFKSPSATVIIEDELVTSESGIGGQGPNGELLSADRMKAYNNDGRVVLEGNVSMRIFPGKTKVSPGDEQTDTE